MKRHMIPLPGLLQAAQSTQPKPGAVEVKRFKVPLHQIEHEPQKSNPKAQTRTLEEVSKNHFHRKGESEEKIASTAKALKKIHDDHISQHSKNYFETVENCRSLFNKSKLGKRESVECFKSKVAIPALAYVHTYPDEPSFQNIEELRTWVHEALDWLFDRMKPDKGGSVFYIRLIGNLSFCGKSGRPALLRILIEAEYDEIKKNRERKDSIGTKSSTENFHNSSSSSESFVCEKKHPEEDGNNHPDQETEGSLDEDTKGSCAPEDILSILEYFGFGEDSQAEGNNQICLLDEQPKGLFNADSSAPAPLMKGNYQPPPSNYSSSLESNEEYQRMDTLRDFGESSEELPVNDFLHCEPPPLQMKVEARIPCEDESSLVNRIDCSTVMLVADDTAIALGFRSSSHEDFPVTLKENLEFFGDDSPMPPKRAKK